MNASPPGQMREAEPRSSLTARSSRFRQAAFIIVLLALPLLCFLAAARQRGVFFVHDIQFYFYPIHASAAALFKHGELPLWNPYAYGGMPLVGDIQTALLYPPNWLFFILPTDAAFSYAVILQFCIAGLGMYLFLRQLQLGAASSFVGAVAFMFCGFMTARVVHLSILGATALIPWVFLCGRRALGEGRARWKAAAAVAIALQVFSGHPQVPIYTACALALFALLQALEQRTRDGDTRWLYRTPGRLLVILCLGYGLAAVQLLPLNELVGHSHRSGRLSYDFIFGNSSGLNDWLLLLFPYAFGALREGLYAATPIVDPSLGSPLWEHSSYVGVLPLSLAAFVIWCFASRLRERRAASGFASAEAESREAYTSFHLWAFLACLLGLSLLVAGGRNTPFSYILYQLPVLGKLRDMERAMVLADFALAALAAIGCELLWQKSQPISEPLRRRLQRIAIATLVVPALVLAVLRLPPVQGQLRPQVVENLVLTRWNAVIPLALALASAGLLLWSARRGRGGPLLQALAVGLVLIDLVSFAASFNPTTDPRLYRQPPQVMAALGAEAAPFRKATFLPVEKFDSEVAKEVLAIGWGMVYGVEDVNGFSSMQPRRYVDYLFGPDMGELTNGLMKDERLLRAESPILSSLNVKYLLIPAELHPRLGDNFRLVHRSAQVQAYENLAVYPRAYFTDEVRLATDQATVLRAVRADGFDGRRLAFIEAPALPALPAAGQHAPARVQQKQRTATRLALATDSTETRFLVLSEMYFPGWRAFVDGVETPIYRTNYVFRGVVVPAGEHEVVFRYRPRSLVLGAAISGLVLLLLFILIISDRRRSARTMIGR